MQLGAADQAHDGGAVLQALRVRCNDQQGMYMLAQHAVRCLCPGCQRSAAQSLMSPTEFERHSGMTAKKWRISIRVAHSGQPEVALGRWLDAKGIAQPAKASRGSSSPELPEAAQQHLLDGLAAADAAGRDSSSPVQAARLDQQQAADQSSQRQQHAPGARPGPAVPAAVQAEQQGGAASPWEQASLSEEPPHCGKPPAAARALPGQAAAGERRLSIADQPGSKEAAAKLEACRAAAYAAATAEAEAAAAQAEQAASKQQRGQHGQRPQARHSALALAPTCSNGRSSSADHVSSDGSKDERSAKALGLPSLLHIPCPSGAPPLAGEVPAALAGAAAGAGTSATTVTAAGVPVVPLEQAAAAAARGDDSLWLRSPVRRTPRSTRPLLHAGARASGPEAVAAEAFRRLVGSHAAAAAGASGSGGPDAVEAAAQLLAAAAAARAEPRVQRPQSQQSQLQGEDNAHEDEEGIEGISVGPAHQAVLPELRPLPALQAASALLELAKAGRRGPSAAEALATAIEEKARSDLLPRDAVEDVWERATGLALERAQRHRKPPGWQAGFVDPLKPQAQHQAAAPGTDSHGGSEQHDGADGGQRGRKRGSGPDDTAGGKRARCASSTGGGAPLLQVAARTCARRSSADGGKPAAQGCCSDPACPGNSTQTGGPPPSGFWTPAGFSAPVGPELLSWLLVPAPARPPPAAVKSEDQQRQQQQQPAEQDSAPAVQSAPEPPPAAQACQPAQEEDAVMQDADSAETSGSGACPAPHSPEPSPAAAAPAATSEERAAEVGPGDAHAAEAAAAGAVACAAAAAAASAGAAPGAVEVRIVLDGCVFVGRLLEVSRLEMARSRVGAAVERLKQGDVHGLPPPAATCALCGGPEAAGAHLDQAAAVRSCGMSQRGLGPLMPVTLPPLKPPAAAGAPGAAAGAGASAGASASPAHGCAEPAAEASAGTVAEAREAGGAALSAPPGEVLWVHRQCALWSPEVYPGPKGALLHLAGAIRRGRATRCSHCGQRGATLKCAERSCGLHYHLACARDAGCTLIPEPYAVACPQHDPPPPPPSKEVLQGNSRAAVEQAFNNASAHSAGDHPLPVLRCRTTAKRPAVAGGATPSGTPRAAAGAGAMDVDGDSDATPTAAGRAGSEDALAAGVLSGMKRSRGGQSRLRHQSSTHDWADKRQPHAASPGAAAEDEDATPTTTGRPSSRTGSRAAAARAAAAAARGAALGSAGTSSGTPTAGGSRRRAGAVSGCDSGAATPTAGADADSSQPGTPLSGPGLGGTTGQPGRAGRCAVCVVQRKGKCGTDSAPKKCLRRQLQEQLHEHEQGEQELPGGSGLPLVPAAASPAALQAAAEDVLAVVAASRAAAASAAGAGAPPVAKREVAQQC